jgi:glutathione S-transferase
MTGLGAPDEAKLAHHAASLDTTFAGYEQILTKQKYLAGDEVALADLFHLPYGKMMKDLGYTDLFQKDPHVGKWFESLEHRESWAKVQPCMP